MAIHCRAQRTQRDQSRQRDQRGAGSALIALVVFGTLAFGVVATIAIGWMSSRAQAARVADLAALAGAQTYLSGGDACVAAQAVASRNGSSLTSCQLRGDRTGFVVSVAVATELRPALRPPAPQRVQVSAAAGP